MDDPRSRAGAVLGDYRLDLLLEESPHTLTWLAEQVSIHRPVVVVELKPAVLDSSREAFLADVRSKAAVDHPLVGSVYEAVSTEDRCFAAMERLPGTTLADRIAAREALPPPRVAALLRRVAEASLPLESAGIDTTPLGAQAIYLDAHGVVRLANLARAGARPAERSSQDIRNLGDCLLPLVADGRPGASRIRTVLAWMRGEGLDRTLTWEEVRSYTSQIEQQLAEPLSAGPVTQALPVKKSRLPLILSLVGGAALIAIAVIVFGKHGVAGPSQPMPPDLSVSAGEHPAPDGGVTSLPAFTLSAHEVTIREYAEFITALDGLPAGSRDSYDVRNQPAAKQGHKPDGWEEMLAAAKSGAVWQGRAMSLDCPVTGVDWWDAGAYCQWRTGCRLPTQEEWFAALRVKLDDPATLTAAAWGPVQETPAGDRTPAGLYGMAGSVSEWTREAAINPANPLGETGYVLAGASYAKPAGGALAREWTPNLLLRRPDLGFRVVIEGR